MKPTRGLPSGSPALPEEPLIPPDIAEAIVEALTEALLADFRRNPMRTVNPPGGTVRSEEVD